MDYLHTQSDGDLESEGNGSAKLQQIIVIANLHMTIRFNLYPRCNSDGRRGWVFEHRAMSFIETSKIKNFWSRTSEFELCSSELKI